MRQLLMVMLVFALVFSVAAQSDSESDRPLVPDLARMTVPEAAAALGQLGLWLNPAVIALDGDDGALNRVQTQEPSAGQAVDIGAMVTVGVPRQANLLLIYDRSNFDDSDFHVINLSEAPINLDGIVFHASATDRTLSTRSWGNLLLPRQCVQAWDFAVNAPYQPPRCRAVQGAGGLLRSVTRNQRFWQDAEQFSVIQDGIVRATCRLADPDCELWVSPDEIAEDVTPYLYLVYDRDVLYVVNRAEDRWMPLFETRLADLRTLDDARLWDMVSVPQLTLLAPQQCVRFIRDGVKPETTPQDCTVIAERSLPQADIFWRDRFTVTSLRASGAQDRCLPAADTATICLLPR